MGLTLPAPLVHTATLLEAAAKPSVAWQHTRWPALEQVLRLLRTEFRESEHNALAAQERTVAVNAWAWVRACLDGPVPPSHLSTGVVDLRTALSEATEALATSRLARLRAAIDAVAAREHPLGERVADLVSEFALDAADDEPPPCALIVRGAALQGVREWAHEENLWVDVVTYRQARDRTPWRHALLFGPPERYVASAWLSGQRAAAAAGWLLSAPPARAVTVLTWTGHGRLRPEDYAPWRGAPAPRITTLPSDDVADDIVVPPATEFTPLPPPAFAEDEASTSSAWMAQFISGGQPVLAFFHPTVGPKPTTVLLGQPRPRLDHGHVRALAPGKVLLLRFSETGRRDALDDATAEWLTARDEGDLFAEARRLQHALKTALRDALLRRGRWGVVDTLVSHGVRDEYAQTLLARLLHPQAIAPLRWEDYARVCRAVGLPARAAEFDALAKYRTARQQAGLSLNALLTERLPDSDEITQRLDEDGGLVIRHERAGDAAVLRLCAIAPVTTCVPPSRLGIPLRKDGHPWQP